MAPPSRSRNYTWDDPKAGAMAGRTLSGLDYMRAVQSGGQPKPPIAATLDFTLLSVAVGDVVFACTPGEHHYNPIGMVHGGLAATLIDSATGCAVHTQLPAGVGYTTINLSIDYIKAITDEVGEIRCHGKVVKAGGRIAIADATITDAKGTVYARGSATCLIIRPEAK